MPNIRELVAAISQRDGVDAAVVLGRDGIVIDSSAPPNVDAERMAAHIPSILMGADDLGASGMRGALTMAVIEQPGVAEQGAQGAQGREVATDRGVALEVVQGQGDGARG